MIRGHVTELLTKYGKIDLFFFFDGGTGGGLNSKDVRKLQPDIVINPRAGDGGGDYGDTEGKLPARRFKGWFEPCVPIWPGRMWTYHKNYGNGTAAFTLTQLIMMRAWGGNLLANLGPKGDGEVPDDVYACWKEMADWRAHSGESITNNEPGPWPADCNTPITTRSGVAYLHFIPRLPDRLSWLPKEEHTIATAKEVMPNLGPYTSVSVWKNAAPPKKATLLRTGKAVPFTYENKTLTVTVPESERSTRPDVVKLEF